MRFVLTGRLAGTGKSCVSQVKRQYEAAVRKKRFFLFRTGGYHRAKDSNAPAAPPQFDAVKGLPASIEWMETRTLLSPPTVAGLVPTTGSDAGGTLVTITGTNFSGATEVDFGATAATDFTLVDDTTITADSPSGVGVVNVTVTNIDGTSPISPADEFTYTAAVARRSLA